MSHLVHIQTEVRDRAAVAAACTRLHWPAPREATVQLFTNTVTGLAVDLPNWRYPVVCQLATGQLAYDNYGGRWGDRAFLERLLQMYAVEKAKLEANRRGHTVTEQALSDGSIKLTIQVGGAA